MLRAYIILAVVLYAAVALAVTVEQAWKKRSIKFSKPEMRLIVFQALAGGTVMLAATYIYYYLGIKTD
jgi:hypothetical protein